MQTSPEIHKLSEQVIGQIAAGEMLERPAHLIKELIENSLDAGSTEIDLDVSLGGRFVRLTDNGSGIRKEDLSLAVERFCTSKISASEDLFKLSSFGFRGEALASTAAVSRLTITSRPAASSHAFQLVSDFGKRVDPVESGHGPGTTVMVEGLFENVPARLKFLRSDSAELSRIKRVFKAFALIRPSVSFRLRLAGQLALYYQATHDNSDSWRQRVEQVLEKKLFVTEKTVGSVRVRACFGSASVVEKTSQNIWVFVQGRFVQDKSIQSAVIEGYRTLLMHGEYPVAAIDVTVSPDEVDVNIHPTKTQVKFLKPSDVFRAVHGTIRDFFSKEGTAPQPGEISPLENVEPRQSFLFGGNAQAGESYSLENYDTVQFKTKDFLSGDSQAPLVVRSETAAYQARFGDFWSQLQVLGQAHHTYIVAQSRRSLFLVDQHAAHERVAFETLMQNFRDQNFEVQSYLIPFTIEFEADEVECLIQETAFFLRMGLELDQMSPTTVAVRSAPSILKESSLAQSLRKWVSDYKMKGESFAIEKTVSDLFASLACHSVVRAGQALSSEEMKGLLEQMDQFAFSGYCPHGRPVYMEYTFSELDRNFGRIV
jgi:DNA mismatch repair protein MutL